MQARARFEGRWRWVMLAIATGLAACSAEPSPPLPSLNIEPGRVAVVGMSSGAYMAQQLHLAYADRILGAGLFAGGPYGCARGDLNIALGGCMDPSDAAMPDLSALAATVRERSERGDLAPLEGLAGDRVFVWHGQKDATVSERISAASAQLYRELGSEVQIRQDFAQPAGHVFPTESAGIRCELTESPFIGACGYDGAGTALKYLFDAEASSAPAEVVGELRSFDAELPAGSDVPGDKRGLIYLPPQCEEGKHCGLLIVLHGCEQSLGKIGERFARESGFNRWADALDLVVLYPQAQSSLMPLNPKACWDWWGYTGPDYDNRKGKQMRWIAELSRALGAPLD